MTEAALLNRLRNFGYGQHYGPMARACAEAAAEIERLRAALWPFAMHHQIRAGYCADDFRRASETMGELPVEGP